MTDVAAPAPARTAALWLLILLLIVEAVIFSLQIMVNKVAVGEGLPTLGYTFWYAFGAGLILLVICALRGDLPPMRPRYVLNYLIVGTTGLAFPFTLMMFVAPKLPAGIVSMLVVLSPLMTYLFALIARLERFRWLSLLGVLLGFAGVLFLILPGEIQTEAEAGYRITADMVGWVLLCLLAPASFALTNVLAAVLRPPAISSMAMSAALLLSASVILFPIMLALDQTYAIPGPTFGGDLALIYAVALNLVIWVLFLEVVRLAGPVFFAQFNYLVVLAGFGFGVLFFDERPSLYIFAAAALMFAGLGVLNWRRKKRAAPEAREEPVADSGTGAREPEPAAPEPALAAAAQGTGASFGPPVSEASNEAPDTEAKSAEPPPAEAEPEPSAPAVEWREDETAFAAVPQREPAEPAPAESGASESVEAGFERGVAAHAAGDYAAAIAEFRAAAEGGSAEACFNIGVMYANGRGVAADPAEAVRWYREAAARGVADAYNNLGHMYEKGLGVPQDFAIAADWYRKAAEQNKPYAQHNLGALYANGQGVTQDNIQAYVWFALAVANHGPGEARDLSANAREQVKSRMSAEEIAEAEQMAADWKPKPPEEGAEGAVEPDGI